MEECSYPGGAACLYQLVRMFAANRSLALTRSLRSSISLNLLSVRTMSDHSKVKSDDQWRAILSPEQVCSSHNSALTTTQIMYSSECSVRRAPNVLERESTSATRPEACTPARLATPHSTRVIQSLTAAAAGQPSSMVSRFRPGMMRVPIIRLSQPSLVLYPATRTNLLVWFALRLLVLLVEVTWGIYSRERDSKLRVIPFTILFVE